VRRCVDAVFDRFRPLPAERVSVVPNGFELGRLRWTPPGDLRGRLSLAPEHLPVLYPHRPDPRKGAAEAIDAVLHAVELLPSDQAERVRLLVPRWMDAELDSDGAESYRRTYQAMVRRAADAGRPDLVHLHDWIPTALMPAYYSLGVATLCVGSFIEAFGNSSVESELCGTPAIVSRVGAQRTVLPEALTLKVDHGDVKTTADLLAAVVRGDHRQPIDELRSYVAETYPLHGMVSGYAEAITGARASEPLPAYTAPAPAEFADIPPWCADLATGYYNDYAHGYVDDPRLTEVVTRIAEGPVRFADLPSDRRDAWLQDGHLIGRVAR
jgi:glycosyltransferase involved in cell wall biosynthesis